MKRPSLLAIFLTVFVDLVGFGIVLPLLPTYAHSFGASGLVVGGLMASYSAMQFLFAPIWGAWSDRVGRRPVLLISIFGNVVSYGLFAFASTLQGSMALWLILISRIAAGICGANITVAQAYIADITPPEDRSKRMGLIGMAFGLGFIIGPALAVLGQSLMGKVGPGLLAAGICAVNWVLVWARLPESLQPGQSKEAVRRSRLGGLGHVLSQPVVGFLVMIFFLATFGFTTFETTLGLLITRNFHLTETAAHNANAILFSLAGLISAMVQAGPIGRLVRTLGESKLIALSLVIFGIGLLPVPWIHGHGALDWAGLTGTEAVEWWMLLVCVALIAIGAGLTRPPLFGLISLLSPDHERGATLGIAQSAGSLARIVGPLFAGAFFDQHPAWPYVTCAILAVLTGGAAWWRLVGRVTLPRTAGAVS
ncbi:MAG TPA: MFS transporter [Verrucomicrobiota bacterium]|nr:MFS transporter [Verrucomicrobiales bacterium]HRI13321.1 MFS transporter [Verrucomicrobiota bacterium]